MTDFNEGCDVNAFGVMHLYKWETWKETKQWGDAKCLIKVKETELNIHQTPSLSSFWIINGPLQTNYDYFIQRDSKLLVCTFFLIFKIKIFTGNMIKVANNV